MKVKKLTSFIDATSGSISLPYVSVSRGQTISKNLFTSKKNSFLDIDVQGGLCDIYANDECIYSSLGKHRELIELPEMYDQSLDIKFADKNVAVRSANIFTADSEVFIKPYGVFGGVSGDNNQNVTVMVDLVNTSDKPIKAVIDVIIKTNKGKRAGLKKKRMTVRAGESTAIIPLKISRPIPSSIANGAVYSIEANLTAQNEEVDSACSSFGFSEKVGTFNGIMVSPDSGVFGSYCTAETELYRYTKLMEAGYDCLRFTSVPSASTLDIVDKLGFKCIVDIFENWTQPKAGSASHFVFKCEWDEIVTSAVRSLRSHPSVVMYCVGSALGESYGRGNDELAGKIVGMIKQLDPFKQVTASLEELVPTDKELFEFGVIKADLKHYEADSERLEYAIQRDMFDALTEKFVSELDVVGVSNRSASNVKWTKPTFYSGINIKNEYHLKQEFEREEDMLGVIAEGGVGFVKNGMTDFDGIYNKATAGFYRDMIAESQDAFIVCSTGDKHTATPQYNGELGEKINIYVYAYADVVELYLNGVSIGRKLAGSINGYVATFSTEYKPGVLVAKLFSKGKEIGSATLTSDKQASAIKLARMNKSKQEIIVEARLVNRDGQPCADNVPLDLEIEGGSIITAGNGYECSASDGELSTYQGKALMLIRANRGAEKVIIKACANKLRYGRITIKIV